MTSFYSEKELLELGFKEVGVNVKISKKVSIYNAKNMIIKNNVRIDDFCILSGNIQIGNYVHIAAYSALFAGNEGIQLEDFSGVSSRTAIYAVSDDYSGNSLTNPTIPDEFRKTYGSKVIVKRHSLVGASSLILPGVILGGGTAIGACSMVNKSCDEWSVYVGVPAKKIKNRDKEILNIEKRFKK